jgi:hypothetical protein
MELKQVRHEKTDETTIGDFFINGERFCYGLEPVDRGLNADMPLEEIQRVKVDGETAIPLGRYQVIKFHSPAHNKYLARVINVPDFDFIEIHIGNFAKDTKGCLVLGYEMAVNSVLDSRAAIEEFEVQFFAAIDKGEEVWIEYVDAA